MKQFVKDHSSFVLICVIYILLVVPFLGSSPLVWYDEGLLSEVSWHFAEESSFKQPVWSGYLRYEEFSTHPNYGYFFLLALFFKLFGLGIVQARLVSVAAGFLLLVLIYYVTKQMTSKRTAVIAALVLALNPLFILSARMVRQEIVLILFGFLAFSLIMLGSKEEKKRARWYFVCSGIVAAYGIVVHLNGVFITLTLCCVIASYRWWKEFSYFLFGLFIGLVPYIVFLALNWEIFSVQFLGVWNYRLPGQESIITNIALEIMRWKKGITAPISLILGIFAFICLLPKIKKWRFLYVPILVLIICFTLFDYHKYYGYLLLLIPFFSILGAIMISRMMQKEKTRKAVSFLLVLFLIANTLLIGFKIVRDSQYEYEIYCESLKEVINEKEVILADPSLFFCFPGGNIKEFIVQIWIHEQTGRAYEEILEQQEIQYIVLDSNTEKIVQGTNGLFRADKSYYEAIIACKKIGEIQSYSLVPEESTEIYECA